MMRTSKWLHGAARVLFAGAVVLSGGRAQAFDAQQFSPAVDPQGYFSVYSSQTAPRGRFHMALWNDFADDPVRFVTTSPGTGLFAAPTTTVREIEFINTTDLVASYSVLDQLELGFDFPYTTERMSGAGGQFSTARARADGGFGQIRLLGKIQLLPTRLHGFGLGVVPYFDFTTGNEPPVASNGKVGGGALVVGDYVYDRLRASLNGGYQANKAALRPVGALNDGSDEVLFGLGVGVLAIKDQRMLFGYVDNVEVLAELFGGSTVNSKIFQHAASTPVEALGGVRFYGPSGLYLTAGLGRRMTDSLNGPALRIVTSLGYSPPPPAPPPPPPPPPTPPEEKVVVTEEQIIPLEPIYFDFDKSTIKPGSYPILDQVAKVMNDRPNMRVRVEGHTDSKGSDAYNQRLSQRRSESVVKYLIGKGIDASRLEAVGFDGTRPIAPNQDESGKDNPTGRAKNRRTEFHVIQK